MIALALAVGLLFQADAAREAEARRDVMARFQALNDCVEAEAGRLEPSGESAGDIADAALASFNCQVADFQLELSVGTLNLEVFGFTPEGRQASERAMADYQARVRANAVRVIVEHRARP